MIVAEGKDNVLGAMEIIRQRAYPGVLAIVDADFDHIENAVLPFNDVAVTDTHDIETMMLSTSAFQKVLLRNGFGAPGRIQVDAQEFELSAAELLSRLLSAGLRIGYLRWASKQNNLKIDFDRIDYARVVDASTLVFREDRLEAEVLRSSTAEAGNWADIQACANALVNAGDDPWQVCNGHDLAAMLALHLGRITGSPVTRKTVEGDLNLGYSFDQFRKTRLHGLVTSWEQRNPPKRILRIA
jgi:hypothetical protein